MSAQPNAGVLKGPGKFCGYSPIIDLVEGETVTTLEGGIHGGTFRWEGSFGTLEVYGIGWASKPKGKVAIARNAKGYVRFKQRRAEGKYKVAIWNREHGAAYFSSNDPLTVNQIAAIDRVDLFNESFGDSEGPKDCKLRTMFVWE